MLGDGCSVTVHHTPPERCLGGVAVVVDVLRWSTTCVTALARGALGVEAFATVGEVQLRAARIGALMAGERAAHRVAGFDLGNSPLEFTSDRVAGRVICATTTNGTRALASVADVPVVFVAGFVNLSATASAIRGVIAAAAASAVTASDAAARTRDLRHVDIVCAGSEGESSAEDSLCAAWLATALGAGERAGSMDTPRDAALAADARAAHAALAALARSAPHANTLRAAGYAEDVDFALRLDAIPLVAALRDGRVVAVTADAR